MKVVVIGAGLSGLVATRELARSGVEVEVIDKGRSVGGRLATRRIDDAVLDHGAQFFTVRGDAFRQTVDDAIADGVVDVWCHGFGEEDGYPRYFCPQGMTALAKYVAADAIEHGAQISTGERVGSLRPVGEGWRVQTDAKRSSVASAIISTAPVPQTLELLDEAGIAVHDGLREIVYKPTLAVLAVLDGPSALPEPGAIQQTEDDLFTFVADNQMKGVSPIPALTMHVNGATSEARYDDEPDIVLDDLLGEGAGFLGNSSVIAAELKKWRFAGPRRPWPDPYVSVGKTGTHLLAGDAFAGPKVEGAFNSGFLAAKAIISGD
ncbi:MAG: NAD(P)/FAD-dependent oxidoreductase [Acidimicrobiales bacterium]